MFLAQFLSSIEGPAMIAMEDRGVYGWLGDENRSAKISRRFRFFRRDFRHPSRVLRWLDNYAGERGDKNRGQKSQTDVFDFFGAIFITHRWSCDDCNGARECVGGLVTKIALKKSIDSFDFFGTLLVPNRGSCDDCNWGRGECVGGWEMKITTKKIEPTFSIFSAAIFVIQVPPFTIAGTSNSRYWVFVQHFWEYKIYKNVWRRRNIVNSRALRLWWVG